MTQLKISDLSVGDWVEFHRTRGIYIAPPLFEKANARVIGTHRGAEVSLLVDGKREFIAMPLSAIHPIPITPEVLEKNGFEENCGRWYNSEALMEFEQYKDGWGRTVNCGEYSVYVIKYVHQLQHALRLAGVEKEIEL